MSQLDIIVVHMKNNQETMISQLCTMIVYMKNNQKTVISKLYCHYKLFIKSFCSTFVSVNHGRKGSCLIFEGTLIVRYFFRHDYHTLDLGCLHALEVMHACKVIIIPWSSYKVIVVSLSCKKILFR